MRSYSTPIKNPTGYFLDEQHDWIWIVQAEATTNKFLNPSFENGVNDWTITEDGSDGNWTAEAGEGFRGLYALQAEISSDGTYVQLVSNDNATASTTTTVSFFVKFLETTKRIDPETHIRIAVNNQVLPPTLIWNVGGGWFRVGLTYTPTGSNPVGLRVIGDPGDTFVIDCAQWEDLNHWTTYCDGDEQGLMPTEFPVPFVWNGTPHASTSSRSFQTHAGGKIIPLSDFNFNLIALEGFGLTEVAHARQSIASADGTMYKTSRRGARTFTLGGRISGDTPRQLSLNRTKLADALDVSHTGLRQPLVMYLQKHDGETPVTEVLQCICTYDSGLGESQQGLFDEDLVLVFTADKPYFFTLRHISVELTDPASTSGIMSIRDTGGQWSTVDGAFGGGSISPTSSRFCGLLRDGTKYMAVNNGLIFRNESTEPEWEAGLSFDVAPPQAIIELASGDVVVVGNFTTVNGDSAVRIAQVPSLSPLENATAFGTGINGIVYDVAQGPEGNIYVVGEFSLANGVGTNGVAYWSGTTFVDMGLPIGLADYASIVAVDAAGKVYITGPGDNTSSGILRWEGGTTWTVIGTATHGSQMTPHTLVPTIDGYLYLFGQFTAVDGVTCGGAAVWNGASWQPLPDADGVVTSAAASTKSPELAIYGVGTFGSYDLTDANPGATFRGNIWKDLGILVASGDNDDFSVAYSRNGDLVVTHERVNVSAGVVTSFANPYSTARKLSFHATTTSTQTLLQVTFLRPVGNLRLNFDVLADEVLTLTVIDGGIKASSNVRPVLGTTVLAGSDARYIMPIKGDNEVSFLCETPANMTAWIVFEPAVLLLDEATNI